MLVNLFPCAGDALALPHSVRLDDYDGIVIHPAVSYSAHNISHFDRKLERGLADYDGVKVLMKQDEQVNTGLFAPIIRDKRFDILLTCVRPSSKKRCIHAL